MTGVTGRSFFDTNILLYADDPADVEKRTKATSLDRAIADGTLVVSTQVLTEYYSVSLRKFGADPATLRGRLLRLASLPVVQVDTFIILAAADRQASAKISLWDALIVEAALAAGCTSLISEDLQAGRRFGDLEIVNPFV